MILSLPAHPATPYRPDGSPAAARSSAQRLRRSAGALDERASWVTTSTASVGAGRGWSGPAATRFVAHVRPVGRTLEDAATSLRSAARAADSYAATLDRLLARADRLADAATHLTAQVDAFWRRARASLPAPRPDVALELLQTALRLRGEIDGLAQESAVLRRDSLAAEDDLAVALRSLSAGAAGARQRLAAAAGDPLASALEKSGGRTAATLSGLTADEAAGWWRSLTADERAALLAAYPEVVGTLDGVPADARDTANRTLLGRDLADLEARDRAGTLDGAGRAALANARAVRDQLEEISLYEDPQTFSPLVAQLYDYEPYAFAGDGRALVCVGDMSTADNVAVNVPGLTTTVSGSLAGNVVNAVNLYQEARKAAPGSTMASVAWIGYDAPSDWDSAQVALEGSARDGGALLARDVAGFLASRGDDRPHTTVVGHSYGSTTTAHAATDVGLDIDDIVLIGSPGAGSGVSEASQLGIGAEHVWVGSASTDYVTYLGSNGWVNSENWLGGTGLGNDPAEDDFGAQRFQAELVDRNEWVNISDHTGYYLKGTESLANMAGIVTDLDAGVVLADHRTDPWWRTSDEPEEDRTPTERSH